MIRQYLFRMTFAHTLPYDTRSSSVVYKFLSLFSYFENCSFDSGFTCMHGNCGNFFTGVKEVCILIYRVVKPLKLFRQLIAEFAILDDFVHDWFPLLENRRTLVDGIYQTQ